MAAVYAHATQGAATRAHSSGRRAYRTTFWVASAVFVATTIVGRLNPLRRQHAVASKSIFAEARARAAATVPFIFMG